jgi:CPA2 family monovalent cation:H+ antiporter-2
MGIAEDIIIIILAGLISGFIAHKAKLPLIIGYIFAGIIVGPYTGGVTVTNIHQIELLAEIGVALLLFSIGLDLSFQEIKDVRKIALIGTPVQLVLTILYGFGIGYFFNFTWTGSLILGTIISLSSTMIVFKTLMSRGLMGTLSSKVMIGILIVQDLAAVPMMIIIPQLNNLSQSLYDLGFTLLKGALVLALVIVMGTKLIPFLLKQVSRLDSHELFLITITALGLGTGYLTYKIGLSFALGAFLTGMVLNKSDYNYKALNDIIPLRDIFGLIFFTSIGMLIDLSFIKNNITTVLLLVVLIIIGKFIIFSLLSRAFGYFNVIPLAVGLGLSQVGEFSFVLARLGLNANQLTSETYSIILSSSVVSMIVSPFLAMVTVPLYSLKNKFFKKETIQTINFPDKGLRDHVVIAGGGRVGSNIASVLQNLGFQLVIIEQDYDRFEKSKEAGFPVIFGDASRETVLSATQVETARLLLITIPSIIIAREIVGQMLKLNPGLDIIARSDSLEDANDLRALNVYEVVQPEFEASLEIIRQSLLHLNIPVVVIQKYIDETRRNIYSKQQDDKQLISSGLKNASYLLEMDWFTIPPGSPVIGKSIKNLKIRTATGATVVGVYRGKEFLPNPDYNFIFQAGDVVAIIGKNEQRNLFEGMIRIELR